MNYFKKTALLIPVFNEEDNIRKVIEQCLNYFQNIIVIDDGSFDNTYKELEKFDSIIYLKHCINCGQGTAIATGIKYFFHETNFDYLITFDGDGQHFIEDAIEMLKYANDYSYDVIFGSRFLKKEFQIFVPKKRKLLLRFAKFFEKIFYNINLSDAHNGLRILNRKACKKLINLESAAMAHSTEIALKVKLSKLRYTEYPCRVLYDQVIKDSQSPLNSLNIISDLIQRK